jgi:hypothetical protein
MSDHSVFNESPVPQETPAQQPSDTSALADQLKGIVNENGEPKYSTIEDALKGAAHAQTYIAELKQKLAETEGKYTTSQSENAKNKTVEEMLARLQPTQEPTKQETPAQQGLDEASLSELIQKQLSQRDQLSKAQQNESQVDVALKERYGEKASEIVQAKAKELGISVQRVKELSQESPQAVLSLFGAAPSKQGTSVTRGSQSFPANPNQDELVLPKKSLLAGATSKDQAAFMAQIKERVYKRNGITN